jgi:hypothetical protein
VVFLGLFFGAAAIVSLALLRDRPLPGVGTPAPASDATGGGGTNAGTAAVVAQPGFAKLKGRWLRQDGDYLIDVRDVGPDGRAEVAYFNPQPIQVARAEARRDGSTIELAVELRDTGYPGCIYRLRYAAGADQLQGTYFQAALGETYEVVFARSF